MKRILDTAAWLGTAAVVTALGLASPTRAQELDLTPLPEGEEVTVRIGVGGTASITHMLVWVAEHGGFFDDLKEEGITVETVPFGGGSSALLALAGGQVDFTYQFAEHAIKANAQGRPVQFIYAAMPVPALGVTVQSELQDEVQSVADLQGKRWGFTSFGSGSHVVSLRVAHDAGIDPAYVSWTPVGGTRGYLPSMREDRVDALTSGIQFSDTLVQEGTAFLLVDLTDLDTVQEIYGYPYISAGLLTTAEYTEENPYVTYKVIEALTETADFIRSAPPEKIAETLPPAFNTPSLELSIGRLAKVHSATGEVDLEVIDHMIHDLVDLNLIPQTDMTAEKIVDNRFVEAVQKEDEQG